MSMCTIGIDIGSTSSKGVLYDVESAIVLRLESDNTRPLIAGLPEGHHEEDASRLRDAAYGVIRRLLEFASERGHAVRAICFTGQMHGGLLVDESLAPLSNFVTWQDKRGDEIFEGRPLARSINHRISDPEREGIGSDIHTGFLGVTASWWKQKGKLPQDAKIIGIYDWIASTLTGQLVSDPSSVAAWGLYNIRDRRISDEALQACGLTLSQFPEIVDIGEHIGPVRTMGHIGPISNSISIVSGMGDTQASYIGSGCKHDEILLNFGTGSQLMIESERFGSYPGTDTRYLSKDKYLIVAPTLAGGKAYAILADFFIDVLQSFDIDVTDRNAIYSRMNELARAASGGVGFTPYFLGSRTHGENERAAITGLDTNNFRASALTKALLEGMMAEVRDPYCKLPEHLRQQTRVAASGNGMRRNPALRDVAEAAFGLPLRLSEFEEEAAIGAALTAARAVA